MKKLWISIVFSFAVLTIAKAQLTFQKTFGGLTDDYGYSAQQTMDGGYIIVGATIGFGAGNTDVYLIKTDSIGDTLWTKTFGKGLDDYGYSVQQTTDSGYIIAGFITSSGVGSWDFYLIRTNANGDTLWTKTYGGTGLDNVNSVKQTSDNGFIIAGTTTSFGAGSSDIYLIKTNTNGDTLWTRTFGGSSWEEGRSVQQTADGGYIITGKTSSFGLGNDDVCLIKTNATGDTLWTKTFGGAGYENALSVQQTADNGYIVVGATEGFGAGNNDAYLIKTDSIGNLLWSKTFGGTGNDYCTSVQQTTDGGYIIAGTTTSFGAGSYDIYLIKTNTNGDTLWTKTFGGANDDFGQSVQQTVDGGYIIAGKTMSFGAGFNDVYLIKTDANGNSGCNQGNTISIVTTPLTQQTIPPTIVSSPNTIVTIPATIVSNGGIVNTLCTTVGISEITKNNLFLISPNPSVGNFIISFERRIKKGNVEILNILGEKVF
ncbi:MAG: hypothetical protein ABI723_19715, partial [Bacteroidia bacterium]